MEDTKCSGIFSASPHAAKLLRFSLNSYNNISALVALTDTTFSSLVPNNYKVFKGFFPISISWHDL